MLLEQFKVLSNSFNEAIITKTSKGEVDYCNLNGIRLLHSISKQFQERGAENTLSHMVSSHRMNRYFEQLKSLTHILYIKNPKAQTQFSALMREKIFQIYQSKEMKEIHNNLTQQVDKSCTSIQLVNNNLSNLNLINANGPSPKVSESCQVADNKEEE